MCASQCLLCAWAKCGYLVVVSLEGVLNRNSEIGNRPNKVLSNPPKPEKSSCESIFLPAILGPEMAAPIVWAPGILAFVLQENRHAHKIPRFRGGGVFWLFGGGADFIFMGARIF